MMWTASNGSSRRFADCALLLALGLACGVALPPEAAACAYDFTTEDVLTFDPSVLGDEALAPYFYDNGRRAFGEACQPCPSQEMRKDWSAWLGPGVSGEDWMKVLLQAPLKDIDGLIFHLQGKQKAPPKGHESSTVARVSGEGREKMMAALFFVGFARRVEPFAAPQEGDAWSDEAPRKPEVPTEAAGRELLKNGEKAYGRVMDPFLKQRYAFQLLRLRFYLGDWKGVASFFAANAQSLEAPSEALKWRAHSYLAGALLRSGDRARGHLELARVHSAFPALGAPSANDFAPRNDGEWKASLALATTAEDKAALWRLVGLRHDALVAMRELKTLEPKSSTSGLLAVRELNRLEMQGLANASSRELKKLEALCQELAKVPEASRPWLFALVAAHAAALRGDLATTRAHLDMARKLNPPAGAAEAQMKATLAIALAEQAAAQPALGDELARTAEGLGSFRFERNVNHLIRARLGGKSDPVAKALLQPSSEAPWTPELARDIIARFKAAKTPYEKFVVQGSGYTLDSLQADLARTLLAERRYAEALQELSAVGGPVATEPLGTDPFVMHIIDCHDCDHERYARGPWTLRGLLEKLVKLEEQSKGTGEPAAQAAYELGSVAYNLTYYGNGRSVLGGHAAKVDTAPAEALYARAFELTQQRELKARAAYMAAKCELSRGIEAQKQQGAYDAPLPIPQKWFPVLQRHADTRYHQEVLAECGHYQSWFERQGGAGRVSQDGR